jgi:hypothetical protein
VNLNPDRRPQEDAMTTIEINTAEQTGTSATDRTMLMAVCVVALLGLAGIVTMMG